MRPRLVKLGIAAASAALALSFALTGCTGTSGPDVIPPEPDEIGVSDSLRAVKACMEEDGFEAEFDHMGGLVSKEMSQAQGELWRESNTRCAEETGYSNPDYTNAQLSELYELEVENYNCLLAAGYAPGEPPSVQEFIDTWQTPSEYQAIRAVYESDPASGQGATSACPPPRWSFG